MTTSVVLPRRRFNEHFEAHPDLVKGIAADSAPAVQARTRFPSTVVTATASPRLLVSGINQRKIGDKVSKGHWAGMPIYCLTLEERATCPSSCHHWLTCYGNNMHWSRRHQHGPEFEFLLGKELHALQVQHPDGFVVRLHILGDFYDAAYVALWGRWLAQMPALHAFGFTARHELSDEGLLIRVLNRDYADRWVIRFSGPSVRSGEGMRAAVTIWTVPETPAVDGAVVCPVQTGKTDCCGTCGFCWTGTKPVAFIAHGVTGRRVRDAMPDDDREDEVQISHDAIEAAAVKNLAARPDRHALPTKPLAAMPLDTINERKAPAHSRDRRIPSPAPFMDPEHAVPLRAIEIRAWLRNTGHSAVLDGDPDLLAIANAKRKALGLPVFRLIPERQSEARETILVNRHQRP